MAASSSRGWPLFVAVTALAAAADLVSKEWVFSALGMPGESPPVVFVPGIFVIETNLNEGALFGMGQGMGAVFATVSVAAIAGIIGLVSRPSTRADRWLLIALGLVVGRQRNGRKETRRRRGRRGRLRRGRVRGGIGVRGVV
jgi:lipoprotein signal peptidase